MVGLDLSPYMLAVAEHAEEMAFQGEFREAGVGEARVPERKRIEYTHRLAEKSGYPDGAFDAVSIAFVFHECPEVR